MKPLKRIKELNNISKCNFLSYLFVLPKNKSKTLMNKTLFLTVIQLVSICYAQHFDIPKAKKVVDTTFLHGDTLIDYYNWMKNKNDINLINYLYAENAYTENIMSNTKLLQNELYSELKNKMLEQDQTIPIKRDDYYYYSRSEKGKNYSILCRKYKSLNAKEEVYCDINKLAANYNFFNLIGISRSPNHKMLAYVVDSKGSEEGILSIKYIKNDSLLEDKIENVTQFMWDENNTTIYYILKDVKTKKSNRIYSHKLGSKKADKLIFEEKRSKFGPSIYKSTSKEYVMISTGSFLETEVYIKNKSGEFQLVKATSSEIQYGVDHYKGGEFIIQTNENAPNGKILSANSLNELTKGQWEVVIPASDSIIVEGYHLFKDYAIINKLEGGLNQIQIINRNNGNSYYLKNDGELKNIGITYYYKDGQQKFRYYTDSYTKNPTVFEYDLVTKKDSVLRIYKTKGYNSDNYTSKRIWSTSKDGTKVPIDIAYKKDIEINENTPLYLTAYASYGQNTFPGLSSTTIMLMDRGFIYAQAHPRGESLFGKKWHDEGKMLKKINTVTDFISCTEFLHNNGYSSPSKTAITGRSAGGMLMGAIVTMRPDLYQAVVPGVPYIDVINGQLDTTMPGTIAHFDEVGNPRIEEQYRAFLKWDPYQNIRKTNYPNMLVLSGYNDPRVFYWLPTKWAAKMREYKTDTNIFILKTDMESGHFGSAGRYKALKETAFEYAFIFKSLGIKESYKTITGTIYDENKEIVPFVNITIKGTQKGTASNFNGQFSLVVRNDEPQELVFSSVGFKTKTLNLKNYQQETIDITLKTEDVLLNKVLVKANAKDPAYGIIKNAIAKRKFHLKQVSSYEADIYLKSTVRFDKLPEKKPFFIKKEDMPDSTDLGLVYLSESSSKVFYKAPNKIKEEMKASVVAGYNEGYSFNRTYDVLFNFYKNSIELPNFSDKLFQSPIASSALLTYRYSYEGTLFENGKQIHKIKVRPRIKGDPLFHGFMYINDSTWSIHSVDLMLTKDAQIKFYDTLNFKQSYIDINNIWVPRSLKLSSKIDLFGMGATFNSVGIFNGYKLNREFPKKFFTNAVFSIKKEANKKDSIYWEDNRPISLTDEERKNYYKEDSLKAIYESPAYKDSVRKNDNKYGVGNFLISGKRFTLKSDSAWIDILPLIGIIRPGMISYNTVEGWNSQFSLGYSKLNKKGKYFQVKGTGRYGFEIQNWGAKLDARVQLNKMRSESITFSGGKFIDPLNFSPLNMYYSLLDKSNYMKINQKTYAKVSYKSEILNGLTIYPNIEIASRKYLQNNSSLSWTKKSKEYESNYPAVASNIDPIDHDQLTISIGAKYVFNQKYELYPDNKFNVPSKLPIISAVYTKGIGISNEETGYDLVKASVQQKIRLGQIGNLSYHTTVGKFFNANDIQFWDYKHFNGNRTFLLVPMANTFETLPYFDYSTNREYLEVHVIHQFNGFILNKIPLIRKLNMQSIAGLNSVINPDNSFYELYFGVENIFNFFRVDFAGAIGNGQSFKPAIRFGFDIGL